VSAGFALLATVMRGCDFLNEAFQRGSRRYRHLSKPQYPPQVANQQLTAGQTSSKSAELRAAQKANAASNAPPPNDIPLLRKIGQNHGQEALDAIEGK
jgi:hypothetical protein